MRLKLFGTFAALLLVAACATPAEETKDSSGSGASSSGSTTQTQTAAPAPAAKPMASVQPTGPVAGSYEDLVANVGDRVFFGYDKYDLAAEAQSTLRRQAAWMKKFANVTVTIEGHCDERGTREYNLALGQRRAAAVKEYLVALGVDANRIATISYGKERPEVSGSNEAAWRQNRRGVSTVN